MIISGHGGQDDWDSAMYKALKLTDSARKTLFQISQKKCYQGKAIIISRISTN
jgi:hypothetical protein